MWRVRTSTSARSMWVWMNIYSDLILYCHRAIVFRWANQIANDGLPKPSLQINTIRWGGWSMGVGGLRASIIQQQRNIFHSGIYISRCGRDLFFLFHFPSFMFTLPLSLCLSVCLLVFFFKLFPGRQRHGTISLGAVCLCVKRSRG